MEVRTVQMLKAACCAASLAALLGCGDDGGGPQGPTITAQPADQTVAEGQTATFTVEATGLEPLSYQWRTDGVDIPGATSSSYTTPAVGPTDHGARFDCVVTDANGITTSEAAMLTVVTVMPMITSHPVNQTVAEGETATFTLEVTGVEPLSYQWQRNGADIPGATGPSYATPPVTLADSLARFRCIVTNVNGSAMSDTVTLVVVPPVPEITAQPAGQRITEGATATFIVEAVGAESLSYQWRKDGVNIPGAVNASYTTPPTALADDGARFTCVVSNTHGSAESDAAALTVVPVLTEAYAVVDLATGNITQHNAVPDLLTNDDHKTTRLVLRRIGAGSFQMGDEVGGHDEQELPVHTVNIANDYYLGVFEVTQRQWYEIHGDWPSYHTAEPDKRPVEQVHWDDCQEFLAGLSNRAGRPFRLPTEAEWEYACKAGTSTNYSYGDTPDGAHMWYASNSNTGNGSETHEVGTTEPNPWGLYDMQGNVWEWCRDWYGQDYYSSSPVDDPQGPPSGTARPFRSGSYMVGADKCRSSYRYGSGPSNRFRAGGFRVALYLGSYITSHPQDEGVVVGDKASFSVTATGPGELTYLWRRDGVDISGATGSSYETPPATLDDDGAKFTCVVANTVGSIESEPAVLTVVEEVGELYVRSGRSSLLLFSYGDMIYMGAPYHEFDFRSGEMLAGIVGEPPDGDVSFRKYSSSSVYFIRYYLSTSEEGGVADMGTVELDSIAEAPESGYSWDVTLGGEDVDADWSLLVGRTFCVRTHDGKYYAKMKIVDADESAREITFDWVYLPEGGRMFP